MRGISSSTRRNQEEPTVGRYKLLKTIGKGNAYLANFINILIKFYYIYQ